MDGVNFNHDIPVSICRNSVGKYIPMDDFGNYFTPTKVRKVIEDLTDFVESVTDEDVIAYNNRLSEMDWERFKENQAHKKKTTQGRYIYLMQCNNRYKIGVTCNVEQRLKELDERPYKVTLLGYRWSDYAFKVERKLHEKLSSYKVGGEWYSSELPINTLSTLITEIEEDITHAK